MKRVVIVGAGFGGLAAAAELARSGMQVTVLEAQVYPGGCASTFYHQGYHFEAGATLAGGFASGAPLDLIAHRFDIDWGAHQAIKAMTVHLPAGRSVTRWTDQERWQIERLNRFGREAEPFWQWQESSADALWEFALQLPPWPPQSLGDLLSLAQKTYAWTNGHGRLSESKRILALAADAFRPVAAHIPEKLDQLRLFADAQLLISAQTTSRSANALYGAAALDLTRQGVGTIPGGMGGMADKLVQAVRRFGGQVHFRQQVRRVSRLADGTFSIQTKQKDAYPADKVIFNLLPWNIPSLLDFVPPNKLRRLGALPEDSWGAFMVYVGLDGRVVPDELALHHQVVIDQPLGEGNSIFLSLSPDWDQSRAPSGKRALTISTHTRLDRWWGLYEGDRSGYEQHKTNFTKNILSAAERVLPGLQDLAELVLPGTPVSFQRFTRRVNGWVGGFPQTSLFRAWGPRLGPQVWMVGDTIFPGQSVPAVMLGGLRVAKSLVDESERSGVIYRIPKPRLKGYLQFKRTMERLG
jgi:C-3',4' desaturase CrtD